MLIFVRKRITALREKHIPKVHKSDPPWLTTNIKRLLRKTKRLYEKYKKSNNINHFETYKSFNDLVTKDIRKSKEVVNDKLTENLENPNTGLKG